MLHILFTTFFTISTLLGLVRADATLHQTSRLDVVARSHEDPARRARLRARASGSACASGYYSGLFFSLSCCAVIPDGSNGEKPSDEDYLDKECCPSGHFYGEGTCCPLPGEVTVDSSRQLSKLRKRVPMHVESGHRTLLNAELAAKYLLGAGEFEHNGVAYKDPANSPYRSWQQGVLMKGMEMVPSYGADMFASLLPKAFATGSGEFALSRNYKAYADDFPEMLEHALRMKPDFDAVYFRGIRIDRDMILGMHKHLPEEHKQRWEDILAEQRL